MTYDQSLYDHSLDYPPLKQRTAPDLLPTTLRALTHRLATEQATNRLPSIVAGVVRDHRLVFRGEFGRFSRDEIDTETQYRIGSITKTFVAVLVMRLRDEGLVRLDDQVDKYIPGSPVGDRTLTHLLTHGSGLQAEVPGEWWERVPGRDWATLATQIDASAVLHPAGRRHHYSNPGVAMLGLVVERVRGASWFEVLDREVLQPLGMNGTTYHPQTPYAQGYAVHPYADVVLREPHTDTGAMSPAGQLWSNLDDLARWARFLGGETGDVLSAATVEEMRHPVHVEDDGVHGWTSAKGLGIEVHRVRGRHLVGHGGSMPGFLANVVMDVDAGIGAVTLANATSGLSGGLHLDLLDILTEHEPAMPKEWHPVDTPTEVLELVGPWFWATRPCTLRAEGADVLRLDGELASRFRPVGDGSWRGLDGYLTGEILRPVHGDDGTLTHLDVGTFCLTRAPYDPDAPIPGGLPDDGWFAPQDTSMQARYQRKEEESAPGGGIQDTPPGWDS